MTSHELVEKQQEDGPRLKISCGEVGLDMTEYRDCYAVYLLVLMLHPSTLRVARTRIQRVRAIRTI